MAYTEPRDWTAGEFVTEAMMDAHIRDNFRAMGPHLIVRKTSDESVTSNTTLQDDNDLIMSLAANEIWRFDYVLLAEGAAGAINIGWTFPSGGRISVLSIASTTTGAADLFGRGSSTTPTGVIVDADLIASPDYVPVLLNGVFVNAGTAGSLTLQWAQKISSATPTTVKANSTLWAVKLA